MTKPYKKRTFVFLILSFVLLAGAELGARYLLGLGTPPLTVSHPTIEYMFKPNQDVNRFGNRILINKYGMRSQDFSEQKGGDELRIMIFGDSVLNGGNLTDHDSLATTRLRKMLEDQRDEKIIIGNISAGSWGPGNYLAYAKEYGFFDADAIFILLSSHDFTDVPLFRPLNKSTHPTESPISALTEGIFRYLPRYLPEFSETQNSENYNPKLPTKNSSKELNLFVELAKKQTNHVYIFMHWELPEIRKEKLQERGIKMLDAQQDSNIEIISLKEPFHEAIKQGKNPYRDNIHINTYGQLLLASEFIKFIDSIEF